MRSNLKKEGFVLTHKLRLQSIMVGEAWLQEQKAAGYKKQMDEHWTSAHLLLFVQFKS